MQTAQAPNLSQMSQMSSAEFQQFVDKEASVFGVVVVVDRLALVLDLHVLLCVDALRKRVSPGYEGRFSIEDVEVPPGVGLVELPRLHQALVQVASDWLAAQPEGGRARADMVEAAWKAALSNEGAQQPFHSDTFAGRSADTVRWGSLGGSLASRLVPLVPCAPCALCPYLVPLPCAPTFAAGACAASTYCMSRLQPL